MIQPAFSAVPPALVIRAELAHANRPCVTSSFQIDCVVLLHMIVRLAPGIPVLFLDTVHHFAETYAYRDELVRDWKLNLVTLRAATPRPGLWQTSVERCCATHKVEPLFAALAGHDVWFTALRREQSATRASLQQIELLALPGGAAIRKLNPLAAWTMADVDTYADRHRIPRLPLYARGYTSIGCEPCTTVPVDPSQPRSGRWAGRKLECGIHVRSAPDQSC